MAKKFLTDIKIAAGVYDSSGDIGNSGQVLSSTGSGVNWINTTTSASVIYQDGFTGDGSTTAFTLANSIDNENKTQVYIDGVYQHKDTFSLSGTTLTFSTAPPNTTDIEVISFSSVTAADDILYDNDFSSAGLMTTNGSGVYSITTNNSSNWNTAYTYSQVGHLPLAGGTLTGGLTGTTATFNGQLTVNPNATTSVRIGTGGTNAGLVFGAVGDELYIGANNTHQIRCKTNNDVEFVANATFTGDITVTGGDLTLGTDSIASNINSLGDVLIFNVDSNANTGGAPNMQFKVSGTTELTLNSTTAIFAGNVGIGTTSPSAKLSLYHATDDVSINVNTGTGGSYPKKTGISFGAISTSLGGDPEFKGGAGIQAINTAASNNPTDLAFWTTSGGSPTERIRIDSAGNVGIGLTNQVVKLEIQDSTHTTMKIRSGNNDNILFAQAIQSNDARIGTDTNTDLSLYSNASERIRINSSGNIGIGTTMNINKLDVAGNINVQGGDGSYLTFNNGDANIVINNNGSGRDLSFKTYDGSSNSERMRIDKDGNVIIGNTNVDNPNSLDKVLEIEHGGSVGVILNDSRDTPIGLENRGAVFHLTHNTNSRLVVDGASGKVGIGTTSPIGKTDIFVGASGYTNNITTLPVGTWSFANGSGANSYPSLVSKSNATGAGMTLVAATDDGAPNGMDFNIREGDNTDFSTLTTSGFTFSRFGTNLMTILRNGKVGIGTTGPTSKFQVEGAPANGVYLAYLYNSATHNSANGLNVQTSSNNILTYGLRVNTAGDSNALAVMGNGSVGIGTASPEQKLHVEGRGIFDGGASSDILQIRNDNGSGVFGMTSNLFALDLASTSNFRIRQGSSVPLYLKSDGNLGIGTTSPSAKLHISEQAESNYFLKLTGTLGTGNTYGFKTNGGNSQVLSLYDITSTNRLAVFGDTEIQFATTGTSRLYIGSSGKVGIGTTSPNAKLEVASGQAKTVTSGVEFARFGTSNEASNYATLTCEVKGGASASDRKWIFQTIESGVANAGNIIFQPSGGNVGIGTTSPSSTLSVQGTNNNGINVIGVGTTANRCYVGLNSSNHGQLFVTGSSGQNPSLISSAGANSYISGGNLGIGTTSPSAKLEVNQGSEDHVQKNYGSGNNQGAPQKMTITKWYPVTSLGTKLLIPVQSQANLNSTTMVRMWGHSAVFNRSNNYTNRSFTVDFTFGSLALIYGLTTLSSSGNVSSVTQTSTTGGTNGEIQINFTNNYIQSQTGASYGGVYVTIEYMTNSLSKSIIPSGIALN